MEKESTTPQPVRGVVVPIWAIWASGAAFVIAIVVAAVGVVIGLRAQEAAARTERELNAQIANIMNELDDDSMSIGMLEARSTQLERDLGSIETRSTRTERDLQVANGRIAGSATSIIAIEDAHNEVLVYLQEAHDHIRISSSRAYNQDLMVCSAQAFPERPPGGPFIGASEDQRELFRHCANIWRSVWPENLDAFQSNNIPPPPPRS